MDLNIRTVIKLEYLVMAGVLTLVLIFDILPMSRKVSSLRSEIKESPRQGTSELSAAGEREEARLRELIAGKERSFNIVRKEVEALKRRMVRGRNVPLITEEIVNIVESSDIELILVKPLPAEKGPGYEVIPIEIKCRSTYPELVGFMRNIASSDLLSSVSGLSVRKIKGTSPSLDISLTVRVLLAPAPGA